MDYLLAMKRLTFSALGRPKPARFEPIARQATGWLLAQGREPDDKESSP